MIRFFVLILTTALLSTQAYALHLTDRQVVLGGTIDVATAQKTSAKLLSMDAGAEAPIYLLVSSSRGTAQGVMLLADTVRSLKSPVVAVVQTEVHGAGAALAVMTDRLVMYRSSGLVFTEISYEGVKKLKPPKKDAKEPPKEPTEKDKLLQIVRQAYLDRFWGKVAGRLKMKAAKLNEKLGEGGFYWTSRQTLKKKVAHSVVEKLLYTKLSEGKSEVKTTTTVKKARTVAPSGD
jgi:hypothetical protein